MKKSKITVLVGCILLILITVLLYYLIFDNFFEKTIQWLSLLFIIISEIILLLKTVFTRQTIINQATIFTSGVHLVFIALLSILFIVLFPTNIRTYSIIYTLFLCVLAFFDLFIYHFNNRREMENKELTKTRNIMLTCYEKAESLVALFKETNHYTKLIDITESLKYSDNSLLTGDEEKIINLLDKLLIAMKNKDENVDELISNVQSILDLRTIKIKNKKRGSY